MTRILTYNILVGGARRIDQITSMIRAAQSDIVGLVEATDPGVVEELAERLGMEYRVSGKATHPMDWQLALLSRLPIVESHVHLRPNILSKPLLEATVQETDGQELTIFVTHLAASFRHRRGGDYIRRREVQEILRIMAAKQGTPHVLMGDFNSLAPGDWLKGSRLLRYLVMQDEYRKRQPEASIGNPYLDFVVPPSLHFLNPLLRAIPRSPFLSALFDRAGSLYAARGSLRLLYQEGYADSFRQINPRAWGFTCPSKAPAGRIDYILASPELASRLADCYVLSEGDGTNGFEASDHLPVLADFGERVGAHLTSPVTPVLTAETSA